jgi:hypothetical protein
VNSSFDFKLIPVGYFFLYLSVNVVAVRNNNRCFNELRIAPCWGVLFALVCARGNGKTGIDAKGNRSAISIALTNRVLSVMACGC